MTDGNNFVRERAFYCRFIVMAQLLSSARFGTAMPLELMARDLALRLCCALIAGAIIRCNRVERGKAARLRTMMLVCMAAAVAMLQMNYLLTMSGRTRSSFVMNDLMRLPLGILTGVGFIGGGAIEIREGSLAVKGAQHAYTFSVRTPRHAKDRSVPAVIEEPGRQPGVSAGR